MKQLSLVLVIILSILNPTFSQVNKDEAAIRQILNRQVNDWNTGNINNFMKGYWNSDSLLFIGKTGPKYGYKTTLENYKKRYPDTTAMGRLQFDILQVRPLSDLYFFVVGKWHLQRSIGDLDGHFTLLFRKIKGEWVIVADHSS
jgi:hypothetical protein